MHRVFLCATVALFSLFLAGEAAAQTTVCRTSVKHQGVGYWVYNVKDCSTGTLHAYNAAPNLPVGGSCASPGAACFTVAFPLPPGGGIGGLQTADNSSFSSQPVFSSSANCPQRRRLFQFRR